MEYKYTQCKFCGTKEGPIFVMPNPEDKKSYWCKNCKKKKESGQ